MIFALWAACQVPATPPKPEATDEQPTCALDPATSPTLTRDLGCAADWDLMAGPASDRWAPGATSVITVIDREDGDTLYFADTQRFPDAWAFVSSTIGRDDRVDQATFLRDNSTRTDRRWILGALTRYPNVDLWLWEPAPYDTADAAMIELAFRAVVAHTWIGRNVRLHLTSDRLEAMDLPDDIETTRTRTLRLLAPWMVLTEGSTIGRLHRDTAESVPLDPAPRELLVIDRLPERLSPRSGTIVTTATPPLGPANLLARAEGAPLVWVAEPGDLAAEGAWAQLDVLPLGWSVQPRTEPEADAWWHDSEPAPRAVPRFLRDVTGVLDLGRLLPADAPLGDALRDALPSYGGAAAHLAALSAFGRPVPAPEGAVIPMAWYGRHMSAAGVFDRIDDLLTRPAFVSDPDARAQELRRIQDDIRAYPVDVDVSRSLRDALTGRYPHQLVRLTASTNAEDDGAVPSADLYDEIVVDLDGSPELLDDALRAMWAQLWSPRVYDQHSRLSIPPHDLGLAILARPERPARAAHGVIITHDGFGLTDREPTMYVNAQLGPGPLENGAPAVEQALVWGGWPASPITRLNDSALAGEGVAVLDRERMLDLADVIERIHQGFAPAYGEDGAWSMEVAFTLGAGGPEIEHVHPWSAP